MGTFLGVLFIVAAAATGVYVGTRPTVMDGRWIAAKLKTTAKDEQLGLACDRAITVGVKGARFRCVQSRPGTTQEVWFRMKRDGKVEQVDAALPRRARPARPEAAPGEPDPADDTDGADGAAED